MLTLGDVEDHPTPGAGSLRAVDVAVSGVEVKITIGTYASSRSPNALLPSRANSICSRRPRCYDFDDNWAAHASLREVRSATVTGPVAKQWSSAAVAPGATIKQS